MKLKSKVAIYIPSTININQSIDNSEQVKNTCSFLSGLFGGCTAVNASGSWISDAGNLIQEPITIVYSYCNKLQLIKAKKSIVKFCKNICSEMLQEAVSLEINNQLYFVD